MADEKVSGLYVFQEAVRAPYLSVIKPKPFRDKQGKEKGEAKFSATFLIEPTSIDVAGIKAVLTKVAHAEWPGRDLSQLHFPIGSGDARAAKSLAEKKKDLPFMKGKLVMDARSKFAVALNVLENGQIIELTTDVLRAQYANKFYGGCWVAPSVNFVAYPGQGTGKDGVTAYFQSLLWVKDGERIGGFDQQALYANYKGTVNAGYDPTTGEDGTKGLNF
jgi:hypothetical protein